VVLAGGTFDILHPGHLKYLAKSKAQGDILVVCVAGDARTRRRKGPNRPIIPAIQRAEIVANLKTVDFVFLSNSKPFSESVLRSISPNVLVTSSNEPSRAAKNEFADYLHRKHPEVKIVLTHRLDNTLRSSTLISKITGT
jgi:cytidyltransferase-like protein